MHQIQFVEEEGRGKVDKKILGKLYGDVISGISRFTYRSKSYTRSKWGSVKPRIFFNMLWKPGCQN